MPTRSIRLVPIILAFFAGALPALVLAGSVDPASAPHQETDHHDHHASSDPVSSGAEAKDKTWKADASLRAGMERIELASRTANPSDVKTNHALADTIDASVQYMIKHCQLDREADAALHPLLARLLRAGMGLRVETDAQKANEEVNQVLVAYHRMFPDH